MQIVASTVQPKREGGRLFETEKDRANQHRGMLAFLRRWSDLYGLRYDAIDLGTAADVDYLVVWEDSYSGGPLPDRVAGIIEYKRRRGRFTYDSLFVEDHKWEALTKWWHEVGGTPIFVAEWDDIFLVVNIATANGTPGVMRRLDRNLPEDTDRGFYIAADEVFTLPKRRR